MSAMDLRVRRQGLAAALLLACSTLALGEPAEQRLDARLRTLYRAQQRAHGAARAAELLERLRPSRRPRPTGAPLRLPLLVRFGGEASELTATGFHVQARVGDIYTGTLPLPRLGALSRLSRLHYVQLSQTLRVPPMRPGAPAPQLRGPSPAGPTLSTPDGLTGAGAVVAVIDTGVDVFHPDFRKPDGSTRIKLLLDLSAPGDVDGDGELDGPGPAGGTLYTESQINAALQAGTFPERDLAGHGTHVLSVAAGSGCAPAVPPGVAPSADLIVVKATRDDGSLGFDSVDVVNALSFVEEAATALGQPYVVNLSLGTLFSSHDGRSLEEQAIDTLVGPGRPGRAAVLAAGNSAEHLAPRYHHFRATGYAGLSISHTLTVPAYTPNPGSGNDRILVDLWYAGRDRHTIRVTGPGCATVSAVYGDYADQPTPCGDVFIANMGGANPTNGAVEAIVLVDDFAGTPPAAGSWTIAVEGESTEGSGVYDGWLADESVVGGTAPYLSANADNLELVGKPGAAYNGITVGSFALDAAGTRFLTCWTDIHGNPRCDVNASSGDLSVFSSTGLTRDGRLKPELTAPGERVVGAVAQDAYPGQSPYSIYRYHPFELVDALVTDLCPSERFGMLQGTSFAAPVVTGLAARLLASNPSLDAIQVRNILIRSALADGFTGAVPNPLWGYGKVDMSLGGAPLPPDLRIVADAVPPGRVGEPYSFVFTASGGKIPYTWTLSAGALPQGLTLEGGLLSGAPTAPGSYGFTVSVADASAPVQSDSRHYQLDVPAVAPLSIVTSRLPTARLGRSYDASLSVQGGDPPYAWSLAGGSLPPGLSLLAGHIEGTPSELGLFDFTAQVEDAESATALRSFRMRVLAAGAGAWDALGIVATDVNAIAFDPNAPSHFFAATRNTYDNSQNAVFESTDAGTSWSAISINNGLSDTASFLGVDPATSDTWVINDLGPNEALRYDPAAHAWTSLASCSTPGVVEFDGNGALFLLCASSKSFLRSDDRGASWQAVGTLCGGDLVFGGGLSASLSVSRQDPSRMYAVREGIEGGVGPLTTYVCRSQDGGATWQQMGSSNINTTTYLEVRVSQADPQDVVRTVQEVSSQYLERSTDGGASWARTLITTASDSCCLLRSPSNPAVLLYGSSTFFSGALFKSTDNGQSWTKLPVQGSDRPVTSLAMDPADANRFAVGTKDGLFLTSDGGVGWSFKSRGLVSTGIEGLALSPANPSEVLLATTAGEPYLSRTTGDKWTAAGANLSAFGLHDPLISAADPNRYWIAGKDAQGLYRSDNRGLTWTLALSDSTCTFCWSVQLADADPFAAGTVLAAVAGQQIYRTTDSGGNWAPVPNPGFGDAFDLAYAHDVPDRVFGAWGFDGVFRSTDGGVSWQPFGFNDQTLSISRVRPAPSSSGYLYAASGSQMFYLDPAVGGWQAAASSPARTVLSLAIDWLNPLVAYAGTSHPGTPGATSGLYKTTDGGRNWTRLPGVLDSFNVVSVAAHPVTPGLLMAATREGGIYRSSDGGASWTALDRYGRVAEVVNVNVRDPSNPSLLFAGTEGYGVQASTNRGQSYVPRVTGLTNLFINAIAFGPNAPSTVYAASGSGLFKSTDSGNHWAQTALAAGRVTDLVTDDEGTAKRIWATVAGEGVAFSADAGATFTIYSTGLASLELTGIAVENLGAAKRIWATTTGGDGVAYSDDLGQTWTSAAGNGLTDRRINDLKIDGQAKRIWATADNGVFFTDDEGLTWTDLSVGLPAGVPVTSASIDPNSHELLVSLSSDTEGGVFRGGNVSGLWLPYNEGLDELRVRRLTNDNGHVVDATTNGTTFYAATAGDGVFASEIRTPAGTPPSVSTSVLPAAVQRAAYTAALAASGGAPPYTWSLAAGSLPLGLELDAHTGTLSGVAPQLGRYPVSVRVSDSSSRGATRALVLNVIASLPRISIAGAAVPEGDSGLRPAVFTLTLSEASEQPVSVRYATADGSATAAVDYVAATGLASFAPGSTSATVGVSVRGDRRHEGDETFLLNLSQPSHAALAGAQALGTILDDDPLPSLSVFDLRVREGQHGSHTVAVRVQLSAVSGETVSVHYATADGSATAPADYSSVAGTLTLPAGARLGVIHVPISGDTFAEGHETFFVDLSSPTHAALGRARARIVIVDDDGSIRALQGGR